MRRNINIIVPEEDFQYTCVTTTTTTKDPKEIWKDATTLYQWGTRTAVRRFCKTCGILPWYTPRSNPDGVSITVNCIDWDSVKDQAKPEIVMQQFDGIHWEESLAKLDDDTLEEAIRISAQSKPK
jgi:hypothetical protein